MTEFDPLDLEGQKKAREEHEDSRKLAALTEQEDFRWLMSDKKGRRILWRLFEMTGVYRTSFTGNEETFFREGQRNVGLMLVDRVFACDLEDQFATMQRENKVRHDDRNADQHAGND